MTKQDKSYLNIRRELFPTTEESLNEEMNLVIDSIENDECFKHYIGTKYRWFIIPKKVYAKTPHWLVKPMVVMLNGIPDEILKEYENSVGAFLEDRVRVKFNLLKYVMNQGDPENINEVLMKFEFSYAVWIHEILFSINQDGIKIQTDCMPLKEKLNNVMSIDLYTINNLEGEVIHMIKKIFNYMIYFM